MTISPHAKQLLTQISGSATTLRRTLDELPRGEWTSTHMHQTAVAASRERAETITFVGDPYHNVMGAAERLRILIETGTNSTLADELGVSASAAQPVVDAAVAALKGLQGQRTGHYREPLEALADLAGQFRNP